MKILFLIGGMGLGNSTRCHGIIEELIEKSSKLKTNLHITVITWGMSYTYFKNINFHENIQIIKFNNICERKDSLIATFFTLLKKIPQFLNNLRQLNMLLKITKFDLAVIDSEYHFYPIYKKDIFLIFLNQSHDVIIRSKNCKIRINFIFSYLIEFLDMKIR